MSRIKDERSDALLVELFLAGDTTAFGILSERYQSQVKGVVMKFVQDPILPMILFRTYGYGYIA